MARTKKPKKASTPEQPHHVAFQAPTLTRPAVKPRFGPVLLPLLPLADVPCSEAHASQEVLHKSGYTWDNSHILQLWTHGPLHKLPELLRSAYLIFRSQGCFQKLHPSLYAGSQTVCSCLDFRHAAITEYRYPHTCINT